VVDRGVGWGGGGGVTRSQSESVRLAAVLGNGWMYFTSFTRLHDFTHLRVYIYLYMYNLYSVPEIQLSTRPLLRIILYIALYYLYSHPVSIYLPVTSG
jgi:hypothetical protein